MNVIKRSRFSMAMKRKMMPACFFFHSLSFGNLCFRPEGRWMTKLFLSSSKRVWSELDKTDRSFYRTCLSKSFCEKRELLHASNPAGLTHNPAQMIFVFLNREVVIIGCQTKSLNGLNEGPVVECLSCKVFTYGTNSRLNCFHFYQALLFASYSCRHIAGEKNLYLWYIFLLHWNILSAVWCGRVWTRMHLAQQGLN